MSPTTNDLKVHFAVKHCIRSTGEDETGASLETSRHTGTAKAITGIHCVCVCVSSYGGGMSGSALWEGMKGVERRKCVVVFTSKSGGGGVPISLWGTG